MPNSTILEMKGVRKSFGPVIALDNAHFQLNSSEIHGLLGGNGAGKTTLMNVLYGLYRADAGEFYLHGQPVKIHNPKDAIRHGIGMVHQHFLQVESYTVTQNIVLGTTIKHGGTLNLEEEEQQIKKLSERFGLEVNPRALIEELPLGIRQRVEILKALYRGVEILILDEPTTNLTPQEVDSLFLSLRTMVEQGMSVIFITHKIREVLSICDRISVMRDGRHVVTLGREESNEEALVKAMVGEEMALGDSLLFVGEAAEEAVVRTVLGENVEAGQAPLVESGQKTSQKAVLEVEGVQVVSEEGVTLLNDCSFDIYENEIFGVAGVAGNGQRELAESLIGLRDKARGRVLLNQRDITATETVELLQSGITYIPEDRLLDGFLPTANVAQNLILGFHQGERYNKNGFLNWTTIYNAARQMIAEYNIRTLGPEEPAANLSGGNIQRVMLARAFSHPSTLLIAHNPTRGLDIPSMEFVYAKILELKKESTATLLLSEDLDELILLSSRIAVLYRGKIVGTLERSEFDRYALGRLMSGVS